MVDHETSHIEVTVLSTGNRTITIDYVVWLEMLERNAALDARDAANRQAERDRERDKAERRQAERTKARATRSRTREK